MHYPLASNTWDKEEEQAVLNILQSKNYTMGKCVKKFEEEFAKYLNVKHAVMVNSGSSANLLMLSLLKEIKEIPGCGHDSGDIIVPALAWSTTFFPVHQFGFKLNFVDIDKKTLNIDPEKVEKNITKNTKAILAVNILGNSCEYKKLNLIAKKNNLVLLEDNCESFGAKYNGHYTGTNGLMGSFSFFFSHHLQTMEGGMVTTDNDLVAQYLKSLRAHGWSRDLPKENLIYKSAGDSFNDRFTFIVPGFNLRPMEMSGAVGSIQLKKWEKFKEIRLKNAQVFTKLFGNQNWCIIQKINGESTWYAFNIILDGPLKNKRDKIANKLKDNGVELRPTMTGNFMKNPVMKYLKYIDHNDYFNSDLVHDNGFFIGNHTYDLTKELHFVKKLIEEEL